MKPYLTTLLLLLVTGEVSRAQDSLWEVHGRWMWILAGGRPVTDVNGDGVTDVLLAIGNGWNDPAGSASTTNPGGAHMIVSGVDGTTLRGPVYGPHGATWGFWATGIGDFDGDGVDDYAAGIPDTGAAQSPLDGEVRVYSGASGQEILLLSPPPGILGIEVAFGARVWDAGDLDADGFDDIAVGSLGGESLYLYGGPDGHPIDVVYPTQFNGGCLNQFASIGDLNGDQVPEFATPWPFTNQGGPYIQVRDGATRAVIYQVNQDLPWDNFGIGIAGIGDVDGDGLPDWVASAPGNGACELTNLDWYGHFEIRSGADGGLIRRVRQVHDPAWNGMDFYYVEAGEDVNGDGVGDVITGTLLAPHQSQPSPQIVYVGHATVYSGRTGTMLRRHTFGGNRVSLLGDLDGDGLSEYCTANPFEGSVYLNAGRVYVWRGAEGDAEVVCPGGTNSTGGSVRLVVEGPISLAQNDFRLHAEGGPPNATGVFFYGPEVIQVPFGDGVLCAGGGSVGLQRFGPPSVVFDADGAVTTTFDAQTGAPAQGATAWWPGTTWTIQLWYRDPQGPGLSGFNLSDALRVTWME